MLNREPFKARRSGQAGSARVGPSNRYPEPVCISSETFGSATNTSTSKAGRLQPAPFSRAGIAPAGPFSRRSEDQVPVGGTPHHLSSVFSPVETRPPARSAHRPLRHPSAWGILCTSAVVHAALFLES